MWSYDVELVVMKETLWDAVRWVSWRPLVWMVATKGHQMVKINGLPNVAWVCCGLGVDHQCKELFRRQQPFLGHLVA